MRKRDAALFAPNKPVRATKEGQTEKKTVSMNACLVSEDKLCSALFPPFSVAFCRTRIIIFMSSLDRIPTYHSESYSCVNRTRHDLLPSYCLVTIDSVWFQLCRCDVESYTRLEILLYSPGQVDRGYLVYTR